MHIHNLILDMPQIIGYIDQTKGNMNFLGSWNLNICIGIMTDEHDVLLHGPLFPKVEVDSAQMTGAPVTDDHSPGTCVKASNLSPLLPQLQSHQLKKANSGSSRPHVRVCARCMYHQHSLVFFVQLGNLLLRHVTLRHSHVPKPHLASDPRNCRGRSRRPAKPKTKSKVLPATILLLFWLHRISIINQVHINVELGAG